MEQKDYFSNSTDEILLTRSEAAKLLNCNLVTLWRYTRAGLIPYYRVGKKMFFLKSEILKKIRVK